MGLRMWAAAIAAVLASVGAAQAADTAKTEHVALRLAPQTVAAAPGSTLYVGLQETIAPGWHTYWRNPGDSGEPTAIAWTLPAGWRAGPMVWPAPERAATGPLVNYVFSNKVLLPTPIQVPAGASPGGSVTLKAAVTYLVCKDVCIPEQAALDIVVPVAAGVPKLESALGQAITETLAAAPKPAGLQARFSRSGEVVGLSITGAQLKGEDVSHAWFYPYDGQLLDHAKPQSVAGGPDGLTLSLPAGYGFTHGEAPKTLDGVLALGDGKAWEVDATPGAPLAGAAGASPSRPSASTGDGGASAPVGGATASTGAAAPSGPGALLLQIGSAFLGGLILNLMPCVFPVLSIKAAALARHVEAPERARAEGLGYVAGVVGAFLLLAGVLIGLRAAGQEVGWGFQLQSAGVSAALTLLMLLVALNLSGVFEVATSVQGAGRGLAARGGLVGSVFTGVLAVVVAAPCTAPFMAPAIGWALVQPPLAALAVFLGLALGLAAPLALVSFVPGAFRLLPKPGPWMEGLRHVLAFPMYATAAWLAWVFASQAGVPGLPFLFGAAVALAFAAWAWGVGQRQEKSLVPRIGAIAGLVAAVPLAAQGASFDAAPAASPGGGVAAVGGLQAQPWSPDRVAELTAQGKPVFVDFTAAWCITCQVNERGALAGARVADAFKKTGAVYLKADWTKRDPLIARTLAANGREGVPLYLVYGPGRATPQVLPQLLTEGSVAAAVLAAAKPA